MMEVHSSMMRQHSSPKAHHPLFVTGLSIPNKQQDLATSISQTWTVSRPMLVGVAGGAVAALCIANLVTFIINLSLATAVVLVFVHPEALKSTSLEIAVNTFRSAISTVDGFGWLKNGLASLPATAAVASNGASEAITTSSTMSTASNLYPAIEYHPFRNELDTIMEVAEEFAMADEMTGLIPTISPEERIMEIAQQVIIEEEEEGEEDEDEQQQEIVFEQVFSIEKAPSAPLPALTPTPTIQLVHPQPQPMPRTFKLSPFADYDAAVIIEEEDIPAYYLSEDDRALMENDLARFTAEEYMAEIEHLYRDSFSEVPMPPAVVFREVRR